MVKPTEIPMMSFDGLLHLQAKRLLEELSSHILTMDVGSGSEGVARRQGAIRFLNLEMELVVWACCNKFLPLNLIVIEKYADLKCFVEFLDVTRFPNVPVKLEQKLKNYLMDEFDYDVSESFELQSLNVYARHAFGNELIRRAVLELTLKR